MFTLQQLLATPGKDKLDAVSSIYRSAFFCAQRLIHLNIKATQSIMDGNMSAIDALMKARDAGAWCATQTVMTQRLVDQIVGFAGGFNEVVAENQQELTRLIKAQTDGLGLVEGGSDSSQHAGPAVMIDVVKSMLDAALKSRNSMLDMARLVDGSRNVTPVAEAPPKKTPRAPAKRR
ncbi:MAG: TIGR01841 family phasin [Zoogloea sp.]|nr:TIGR01841 family phasin [Zoogloea sp.]